MAVPPSIPPSFTTGAARLFLRAVDAVRKPTPFGAAAATAATVGAFENVANVADKIKSIPSSSGRKIAAAVAASSGAVAAPVVIAHRMWQIQQQFSGKNKPN